MPTLNIEADAHASFRDAVWKKHGTLRGTLQQEASDAIRAHTQRLMERT